MASVNKVKETCSEELQATQEADAPDPLNDDLTIHWYTKVRKLDDIETQLGDMAFVLSRIGDWIDEREASEHSENEVHLDAMALAELMKIFSRDLYAAASDIGNRQYRLKNPNTKYATRNSR